MATDNIGTQRDAPLPDDLQRLSIVADAPLFDDLATHCYVVQTSVGTMVIDPPSQREVALAEIERAATSPITAIVVTHSHADHIGGVAALYCRTGAMVYAHPLARNHLAGELPFSPLHEGARLAGWLIWQSPGHRADSITLLDEQRRIAIVGDLVAGSGTVVIDPPDGDLAAYLDSLHRLRKAELAMLLPGHGPTVVAPRLLLDYYIAHRTAREQAVLAALAATPQPLAALLPLAYADVAPALHPLAARSLLAHLLKLEMEGRARQSAAGWGRAEPSNERH